MRRGLRIVGGGLAVLLVLLGRACAAPAQKPLPVLPKAQQEELTRYLKQHWQSPEGYIVSKFQDHDIVFLGEMHRVRHDVQLVQDLIPLLYKAGIRNLGIELGCNDYQNKVDQLITADKYDEKLARWLMFEENVSWGYLEYEDLYRAAWKLNASLPAGTPKFRVVGLNYRIRWDLQKENMSPADRRKVWPNGDSDVFMAGVIQREFVDKGQKALIYGGLHHAFTRYQMPAYDVENKKLLGLVNTRAGNLVYAKIGDRACTIALHAPWFQKKGMAAISNVGSADTMPSFGYPAGGAIDRVLLSFSDTRVGFDVRGTPFGQLRDDDTYYAFGHDGFKLEDFCDGYIYQRHFRDYQGCRVDRNFVTEANLEEARNNIPNLEARKSLTRPSDFIRCMEEDADVRRLFPDLQ